MPMQFTDAQRDAIELPDNLVVTAGAGSGKTRVLVTRYLRLLETSDPAAGDILAITFTEKAAREMRERVRAAVEQRMQQASNPAEQAAWEERRAAVEAARIGTIHSFCAALLRAQPAESGIDPRFSVLDEVERSNLLDACVDQALSDSSTTAADSDFAQQFAILRADCGLEDLRAMLLGLLQGGSEVRAAIEQLPIDAPALAARWQRDLAAARHEALDDMLHSTAWQAACDTLRQLAPVAPPDDRLGKQVIALESWLADLEAQRAADPHTLPDCTPLATIDLRGGSKKGWPQPGDKETASRALRALRESYQAATLLHIVPDDDLEARAVQATLGLCTLYRRAWQLYAEAKHAQDQLDFDDLERHARALLTDSQRVRERWQAEFQAVLVDEFQDTNDEQRAIIYALTGFAPPAPPGAAVPRLFVVGDGKQSIFRFRGADVSVFRDISSDIQAQGGRVVALDTSFRTHARLLGWINQVAQAVMARAGTLKPYEMPFEPLHAHRTLPPYERCVELHIVAAASADEARASEGALLAERIQALTSGAAGPLVHEQGSWRTPTYGDIAILCQASTVFAIYEAALRSAGIPYLTTAGRGYYGRKEVQDLIHLLRVLNDPADELALVGVLRSPLFALDDGAILRLRFASHSSLWHALLHSDSPEPPLAFARETLHDLYRQRGQLTVVELLRAVLAQTGYLATISGLPNGEQRRVNVEKLIEAARQSGSAGLFAFSDYLETLLKAEPREGEAPLEAVGSVRLMTVHASKGLEFPIVILPDLGRSVRATTDRWLARRAYGLALKLRDWLGEPQQPAAYQLALAEERRMERAERERLLYVALTRASDYLILSGRERRSSGDDWLSRLLLALEHPWEQGGPTAGSAGPLDVWRH